MHDDHELFAKAEDAIRAGAFLLPEVLAEVVYVLCGVYSVDRPIVAEKLQILLTEVESDHPDALAAALSTFASTKLDFVDCLLAGYHECRADRVVTFDRKLNRLIEAGA